MREHLPIGVEDEPGCPAFESTLGLLDDTLSGPDREAAEQHAQSCGICGPMVTSWEPIGGLLRGHFDSAAERAKPYLADVPVNVFARIDAAKPKAAAHPGWVARLWASVRPSQPYYAFAAAAAVAVLVAVPLFRTSSGHSCDLDTDVHSATPEAAGPAAFHVHEISFGPANGTGPTAGDELPVIWVSESDGA